MSHFVRALSQGFSKTGKQAGARAISSVEILAAEVKAKSELAFDIPGIFKKSGKQQLKMACPFQGRRGKAGCHSLFEGHPWRGAAQTKCGSERL
jgi:hypothetical protein